jgi:hypothetical protein
MKVLAGRGLGLWKLLKFPRSTPLIYSAHFPPRFYEAVLPGDSVEGLDVHCTRNMDWEAAQLKKVRCALMAIAVVLGSAVGGSFVKVQGLDLCRHRSYDPGIGNLSMDLAKVMDETWVWGRK